MKLALLIQAHRDPELAARLCRRMAHGDVTIYLNIDAGSDDAPFRAAVPSGVRFVEPRTDVRWGMFSQVEATLRGLEYIDNSGSPYDYVAFVSGQDYPIVAPQSLLEQLGHGSGAEYMSYRMLDKEADKETLRKAEYRHFRCAGKAGALLRRVVYRVPLMRRRYPSYPVFKGSSWWTLTNECVKYILEFAAANPRYVRFHRHAFCADELFFHNIVLRSPFAQRVTGDDKRYIDWADGSPNPKLLGVADFDRIMSSGDWFARKFDATHDGRILDMIDEASK